MPQAPAPTQQSSAVSLDTPVGLGLTVGDVRQGNEAIAARAQARGATPGAAMAICQTLTEAALVSHCTELGEGAGAQDRTSFELVDPSRGRGLIYHYGSAEELKSRLWAFNELGSFHVENLKTGIMFVGAEALNTDEVNRVRSIIEQP